MRHRISIRGFVRPYVCPYVRPSVRYPSSKNIANPLIEMLMAHQVARPGLFLILEYDCSTTIKFRSPDGLVALMQQKDWQSDELLLRKGEMKEGIKWRGALWFELGNQHIC